MYDIVIVKSAIKDLSRIAPKEAMKILHKINNLKDNARPNGCIKLTGSKDEYRIRIGNYRVIYTIEDKRLIVFIIKISERKDAY